ncbi:unnamed protein product [Peronospora destructor]|uniref:Uncharacterized protein n=1 Tax=Peronospora destructor TaxID=86335 RepID=A0AAV0SWI4_9STRA|nr:unnamed protein product [Peronospora destructor]
MISLKKSLFASAVAVALITTAGNVDGYDVVMSSKSTYNMKRTLRVAAEEAAEEEMADDSECESFDVAEDKTKTNASPPPTGGDSGGNETPVSSGNAQESSPTQTEETDENKDGGGGGDAKEKDASVNDDSECDSLEMADTDSECNSLDMAPSDPAKSADDKKSDTKDADDKKADIKDAGGAQPPSKNEEDGSKKLPTSNTKDSASPAISGSGNNNEKYDGKTSDIDFNAVQEEVNPGTVVPQ